MAHLIEVWGRGMLYNSERLVDERSRDGIFRYGRGAGVENNEGSGVCCGCIGWIANIVSSEHSIKRSLTMWFRQVKLGAF